MAFFPKIQVPILHRRSRPDISRQMTMSLTNKGLLNPSGHNNCFLNSCVQVLWHVDVFRRSFREFKGHTCVGHSCIFCALQALFTQFQHSNQSALPPDDLRQAMAHCYQEQHRFQLGLMDDAAECFEKILEQIHFHLTGSDDLDSCSALHCLSHQKCALSVLEMTECMCGETSEPLAFIQFIHYVSAPNLGAAAKQKKQEASYPLGDGSLFGALVRSVSGEGEGRECATCQRVSPMKKMLLNSPDLVCIGMIWDSDQPSIDDIMSVVESVGTTLRVSDVFHRVMSDASSTEYWLSGMVAYYGRHYSTFCYHTSLCQWGYFDDANFRTVSNKWSDVVQLCRKAHYQPLLLVYTNPFAEKLSMATAPLEVTKVDTMATKTMSLAPVAEEDSEGKEDDQVKSEQLELKSDTPAQTSDPVKSNLPLSQASHSTTSGANTGGTQSLPATSQTQSGGSGAMSMPSSSKQEPEYEIDPLTLSVRPVSTSGSQGTGIYPQLPGVRGERGGGEGGSSRASTAPTAPPLQPQTTSSPHKASGSSTNSPIVFQSSSLPQHTTSTTRPRSTSAPVPAPSFPVHFSRSPHPSLPLAQSQAQPHYPPHAPPTAAPTRPYNPYPYAANRPAPGYSQPRSQPPLSLHNYQTPPHSNYPTTRPAYTGGYPPPTRYNNTGQPNRPPHQHLPPRSSVGYVYPNTTQQTWPWRGTANSSPVSAYQPQVMQTRPQTFFYQTSPHSSPSLSMEYPPSQTNSAPYPSQCDSQLHATSSKNCAGVYSPAQLALIARPRPFPPHSVPAPNQGDERSSPRSLSHSASANATPDTSSDNLIEFSLSPDTLLSATKSNPGSNSQGHTPPWNATQGSGKLLSTSGSSSHEVRPVSSRTSTDSLEGDLIQWSITPNLIQKVQKYRGRQGIRQGSMDSLQLSVSSAVRPSADARGRETGASNSVVGGGGTKKSASQPIVNLSNQSSKPAHPASSTPAIPTSAGSVLVNIGDRSGENGVREHKIDDKNGEQGREGARREKVKLPPDPLYTDPDMVHTMLVSIAGTRGTEEEKGVAAKASQRIPPNGTVSEPGPGEEERRGLGEDPMYAVPEQVMAKMRAKKAQSAVPATKEVRKILSPTTTTPSSFPASVEALLLEARAVWHRAESKRDSDITMARINYSRAATLLTKVLLDPAVAEDRTLRHNISHKREEALAKCDEMAEKLRTTGKKSSLYGGCGTCSECGRTRQLNTHQICGPCHLKEKISRTS